MERIYLEYRNSRCPIWEVFYCSESLGRKNMELIGDAVREEEYAAIEVRIRAESEISGTETLRLRTEWEQFERTCHDLKQFERDRSSCTAAYEFLSLNVLKVDLYERVMGSGGRGWLYSSAQALAAHVPPVTEGDVRADNVGHKREPDSKTDNKTKFPALMPDSQEVRDLCRKLQKELPLGRSAIAIAREFTGESEVHDRKAQSLLRQTRRFPHLFKKPNK